MSERSFSQGWRCGIVAHRGASATEAENTIPAFEAAVATGAEAVEFDVRMTADGVAVVIHDAGVERTTDGRGLVRGLTLAELKRLRIRTSDGGSADVPTLEEVLRCLSGRVAVDVEIKNIPGEPDFDADQEAAVDATLMALDRTGFTGGALLSSFNPFSIAHARRLAPDVETGLLTDRDVDARASLAFAREQGHPWVLPHAAQLVGTGGDLVEEAHAVGVSIGTWVVDEPETAVALMHAGVDAIATNDPAAIVPARDAAALG